MALANGIRGVRFERSGGLFFLVLGGEVALDGPTPGITTEAGVRAVSAADRAVFAGIDVARARTAAMPLAPAGADTYQWDVILMMADGTAVTIRWHAHAALDPTAETIVPGIAGLAAWVGREVDRIWTNRTGAPRP